MIVLFDIPQFAEQCLDAPGMIEISMAQTSSGTVSMASLVSFPADPQIEGAYGSLWIWILAVNQIWSVKGPDSALQMTSRTCTCTDCSGVSSHFQPTSDCGCKLRRSLTKHCIDLVFRIAAIDLVIQGRAIVAASDAVS